MLSDVTISVGTQSITLPGLYLLIGVLIVLGLAGFVVAMRSSRRIERKTSDAIEILVVQLERIGDTLDRLVTQSAARVTNEGAAHAPQRHRFLPDWPVPGKGTPPQKRVIRENSPWERAEQKLTPEPIPAAQASQAQAPTAPDEKPQEKQPQEESVESGLSEPARSILFSMLGR